MAEGTLQIKIMLRTLSLRSYPGLFRLVQIYGPEKVEALSWLWSGGAVVVGEGREMWWEKNQAHIAVSEEGERGFEPRSVAISRRRKSWRRILS